MYLWKSLWVTLIAIGFVLVFNSQLSGAKFYADSVCCQICCMKTHDPTAVESEGKEKTTDMFFFKQMPPNRNAKVSLGAKMVSHETK